jgi:hypothetical protein
MKLAFGLACFFEFEQYFIVLRTRINDSSAALTTYF